MSENNHENCSGEHCHHCAWVDDQINKSKMRSERWDKVLWAVLATVLGGVALTIVGALGGFVVWAIQTYMTHGVR